MTDPRLGLPPGRRIYEQVRALRRARRRYLLRKATVAPREPGKVLQFPPRPMPPDEEVS
jgi:hypothetical protein